jgi:hypothetical protein
MAEKPFWQQEMNRAQREIESARNEQAKEASKQMRSGESNKSLKGKTRIGNLARGGMAGGGFLDQLK